MGIKIQSAGAYCPPKTVTNDDLAQTLDTSDEWIYSHTGIKRRHIADAGEYASDLAVNAANAALKRIAMPATELDMIIVATSTPDYIGFPSTAALVQERIGAINAGAFDLSAACTGFIYALETARGMILSGTARNVMVIGAEVMSRILDWQDRNTCVLFGDGAGAVILSNTPDTRSDVLKSILRADGSGADALMIKAGGCRYPLHAANLQDSDRYIHMDGRRVYTFAVKANTDLIIALLEAENYGIDDIRYIVPHQANYRIIQAAAKRLFIPESKIFSNIAEYANTSAASIPIAINDMLDKQLLKNGDLVLLLGFGAGLTSGGTLLRW